MSLVELALDTCTLLKKHMRGSSIKNNHFSEHNAKQVKASPVYCWMLTNETTLCFTWIFKCFYCSYLLHDLLNTDLPNAATHNNQSNLPKVTTVTSNNCA